MSDGRIMAVPTAVTQAANPIGDTTARLWGKISNDGGKDCQARFRWIPKKATATDAAEVTGFAYCHGFVYYNGYLYGSSATNPGKMFKVNPSDLSDFTVKTINRGASDAKEFMDLIVYDTYLWAASTDGYLYKVSPSNLSTVSYKFLGQYPNTASGAMCCDGTHIFITVGGSWGVLTRYRLSDEAVTSETIVADKNFHSIAQSGDHVFLSDTTDYKVHKVLKSDLSLVSSTAALYKWTDDVAIGSTYLYLAREVSSGAIDRIRLSDLAHTALATGVGMGSSYGVYKSHNGEQDVLVNLDATNNCLWVLTMAGSLIRKVDLTGFATTGSVNEMAEDSTHMYLTQWKAAPIGVAAFDINDVLKWNLTDWQGSTLRTNDTFYHDLSGLVKDTEHEFQTQAKNLDGEGAWSSSAYFTTLAAVKSALDSGAGLDLSGLLASLSKVDSGSGVDKHEAVGLTAKDAGYCRRRDILRG